MTEIEFNQFQEAKNRIDELEEEIYALFEAQNQVINPIERIINTFSITKKIPYSHKCEIKLTLEDINMLQNIRQRELNTLRKIIQE